jgi:hypothetical protein
MKTIAYIVGFFCILACISSCKKFVQVAAPVTYTSSASVYTEDATAAAVLTGIYTNLSAISFTSGGLPSVSLFAGLSADELTLYNGVTDITQISYYRNSLTNLTVSETTPDFWSVIYPVIYIANAAIEGVTNSNSLTPAVKQQLLGEGEFIRAFCYFYLVNLYGDVPLILGTNYAQNEVVVRTPQAQVWQQIITDLVSAQNLLSTNYLDATLLNVTTQRIRPTKWAAAALLARTYLYNKEWSSAESEADSVIGNSATYSLDSLNGVFLANSTEAIWQFQPVSYAQNTPDGAIFILPSTGPSAYGYSVYLSNFLLDNFENGDQRKIDWIDSVSANGTTYYYPFKYKVPANNSPVTEYEVVFRLAEQYLIRAEARAEQGNFSGAASDLNLIRARAGLAAVSDWSQAGLLSAILHERQVELFTEWGHRWLDLKRTGTVDAVMGAPGNICQSKGGIWNSNLQWYPISLSQLKLDTKLVQNVGY